jgi:predicted glycosyltransferase
MTRTSKSTRLLIYSHDSFGLGHLRRCRTIAHSLVNHRRDLTVLILSGSPIIGSFDFGSRVDFVRIPGVIKLRDGAYTSLNLDIDIEETLEMRSSIIRHTAAVFNPDFLLVDKEPFGLRGELKDTLTMLSDRGTPLILGLRDVMDDPEQLAEEWDRKGAMEALESLYNQIWVYGLPEICDPLEGLGVTQAVRRKMTYTGYLRRAPTAVPASNVIDPLIGDEPFILVTTGGGGDGAALIDWVLRAYEQDPDIPMPALLVLGPFMHRNLQAEYKQRASRLGNVTAITFDSQLETLMLRAAAVVAMGGYNTFCEILSFDKRALIVPRKTPRLEQTIRASRAQDLGLIRMLDDDGLRDAGRMAHGLRALSDQPKPSETYIPGLLDGLSTINGAIDRLLTGRPEAPARLSVVPQAR